MAEIYTGVTTFGLYDDQTSAPLFGVIGATAPTSAIAVAGKDNSGNLQYLQLDGTGALVVTGSISATNPSVSATGAVVPADATYIGGNQGGNLVGLAIDGSGWLEVSVQNTVTVTGTVTANQGGAPWTVAPDGTTWALTGTSANVNVTNTVTVTGTVAATQSGTWTIDSITNPVTVTGSVSVSNFPALQNVNLTQVGGSAIALGQAAMAASVPVVIASNQSTITVIPADEAKASSLSYYSYDSGAAYKNVTSANTPLWTIQANSATITFLLRELQWFTDGSVAQFRLVKNGTLTGATYAATSPSANMQVDTAATVITGGTTVMSGYVGSNPRNFDGLIDFVTSGTPGDRYTMVVSPLGSKTNAVAQIRWSEQTGAL